jgi:hypothetical protein
MATATDFEPSFGLRCACDGPCTVACAWSGRSCSDGSLVLFDRRRWRNRSIRPGAIRPPQRLFAQILGTRSFDSCRVISRHARAITVRLRGSLVLPQSPHAPLPLQRRHTRGRVRVRNTVGAPSGTDRKLPTLGCDQAGRSSASPCARLRDVSVRRICIAPGERHRRLCPSWRACSGVSTSHTINEQCRVA